MEKQKSYAERLQEQMRASNEFTKENFGLKVGDGFPELVRELASDTKVSGYLVAHLAMATVSTGGLADKLEKGNDNPFTEAILGNLVCFEAPLAMLYWGIQIGRQLEREEVEALKRMGDG